MPSRPFRRLPVLWEMASGMGRAREGGSLPVCVAGAALFGEQVTAIQWLPAGQLPLQGLPGLVPLVPVGLVSLAWACVTPSLSSSPACTWKMVRH